MKRENRYVVVKQKDLAAALDAEAISRADVLAFHRLCADLHAWRLDNGKRELACVVVEDDWPEYGVVWQMIERRVDGVPSFDRGGQRTHIRKAYNMEQQHALMKFDPATGEPKPYPSHAAQWREYHGESAWLFNPWTGAKRSAGDVCSDLFGELILPDGEKLVAANKCKSCGGSHPNYQSCSGPSEPPRPAGHNPKA